MQYLFRVLQHQRIASRSQLSPRASASSFTPASSAQPVSDPRSRRSPRLRLLERRREHPGNLLAMTRAQLARQPDVTASHGRDLQPGRRATAVRLNIFPRRRGALERNHELQRKLIEGHPVVRSLEQIEKREPRQRRGSSVAIVDDAVFEHLARLRRLSIARSIERGVFEHRAQPGIGLGDLDVFAAAGCASSVHSITLCGPVTVMSRSRPASAFASAGSREAVFATDDRRPHLDRCCDLARRGRARQFRTWPRGFRAFSCVGRRLRKQRKCH